MSDLAVAAEQSNDDDDTVVIKIPRSALQIVESPRCVSQRNCERILGIDRRSYLQLCRDYRAAGGCVLSVGKLRICELDGLLSWMRARSVQSAATSAVPTDDDDLMLMRELGLRPAKKR